MSSRQLLYSSTIERVRFCLSGDEDANEDTFVEVTSHDLFRNGEPLRGGVHDAHMGSLEHMYKCQTCHNRKSDCPGHEGRITLKYPVINPMAANEIKKWLKLICHKCGHPVIPESMYMKFSRGKRLDEASKIARSGTRKCHVCKEDHPVVKKDPSEPLAMIATFLQEKKKINEYRLYPHMMKEILSRVSDETVVKLGKNPASHPQNFVRNVIRVPPVTVRPDVRKIGGGRSSNDDLTTMLQLIIKKNDTLPSVVPAEIPPKLDKAIFEICHAYYDFVRANGEGSMLSLAKRIKSKQGRIRKNMLGKRAHYMCRSTIIGDSDLRIDEVGVPLSFARKIQFPTKVQDWNKATLLTYINNGRNKYPGATRIVKRDTGVEYDVSSLNIERGIELQNGDTVWHDMLPGTPVLFNRQPSLMVSNISCHTAVITENDNIKALRMNVAACSLKAL